MTTLFKYIDPDHIFNSYLAVKIKMLILFSFLIVIWWVIFNENSIWLNFLIFYISLIPVKLFVEIGYHRFFSHRSFKTSEIKKKFLLIGGTLIGVGSCISYAGVHRAHHRYSDTDKDPHSPKNIGIIRTWLTLWDKNWVIDFPSIKDLIRDPLQMFLHRNYFKIVLSWIVFLSLISYFLDSITPLLMAYAIPNLSTFIIAGLTNALAHTEKFGYVNFQTNDSSRNNQITKFLFLNVGSHNNHHAYPNAWDFNVRKKWFEFDLEGMIIKHFFIKQSN